MSLSGFQDNIIHSQHNIIRNRCRTMNVGITRNSCGIFGVMLTPRGRREYSAKIARENERSLCCLHKTIV